MDAMVDVYDEDKERVVDGKSKRSKRRVRVGRRAKAQVS
jgi:hypothetical protein